MFLRKDSDFATGDFRIRNVLLLSSKVFYKNRNRCLEMKGQNAEMSQKTDNHQQKFSTLS